MKKRLLLGMLVLSLVALSDCAAGPNELVNVPN